MEKLVKGLAEDPRPANKSTGRKPISEFKVIQNVAPLTDDKSKFRDWNRKCVNAMGQVNSEYETALTMIMKWADADAMADVDKWHTATDRVMAQVSTLDTDQFGKDLKNVCSKYLRW